MITAHAPSGYIVSRLLLKKFCARKISATQFILSGVIGALTPDLDIIYFYLVDHRHHHHTYFPHWPILWFALLLISCAWLHLRKTSHAAALAFIFSISGMLHMMLDSIVGDIWWFAPFVDKPFSLFTVHALYKPWWLNFLLHWSFALEIAIWMWAIFLYKKHTGHADGTAS
jgi:inner membrane protein